MGTTQTVKAILCAGLWLLAASLAFAQQSASFVLEESAFNQGGSPGDGVLPISASFRIGLSSLGDTVRGRELAAASFSLDGGSVLPYRPAGEVLDLRFADGDTLVWEAEGAAGDYSIYRDLFSELAAPGFGQCTFARIATTTWNDNALPPPANGYFYLVVSRNRLGEEGPLGAGSDGLERPNLFPCP